MYCMKSIQKWNFTKFTLAWQGGKCCNIFVSRRIISTWYPWWAHCQYIVPGLTTNNSLGDDVGGWSLLASSPDPFSHQMLQNKRIKWQLYKLDVYCLHSVNENVFIEPELAGMSVNLDTGLVIVLSCVNIITCVPTYWCSTTILFSSSF